MNKNPQTVTGEGDEVVVFRGNDGITHSRKVGKVEGVTVVGAEIITRKTGEGNAPR